MKSFEKWLTEEVEITFGIKQAEIVGKVGKF